MQQTMGSINGEDLTSKERLQLILQNSNELLPADILNHLIEHNWDQIPIPGSGQTLERWRRLAEVASSDLSLAKLYEGHTDALAILAELKAQSIASVGDSWAVWCAEPPDARVVVTSDFAHSHVQISGLKPWCSGAHAVDKALVSGWLADGQRCLVAVSMDQPSISIDTSQWNAVGMADSASARVSFKDSYATVVGLPGEYLNRPGFIHGGAGVAACWFGAAASIAFHLHEMAAAGSQAPYRLAHLGAVDVALSSAASLLREAAAQIDRTPQDPCLLEVSRARLAVEEAVEEVMQRIPRAIGPGPLCMDKKLAKQIADLPVFVRQSHAEHDQAALGRLIIEKRNNPWIL